jgi:hypothetical protein
MLIFSLTLAPLGALCTACGETDGAAAGEQFSPYNRLVRDYKHPVILTFNGDGVRVTGEGADLVQIAQTDASRPARLTISSTARGIAYFVSGKSSDAQLRIESSQPCAIYLNNATLSSTEGPVVESTEAQNLYVVLCKSSTNTLTDSGHYPLSAGSLSEAGARFGSSLGAGETTVEVPGTACFYTAGRLIFDGEGTLKVRSVATPRYEAALGDTLRIHALTAACGLETPYAVTVSLTATGGDGIHAADSTLQLGSGAYTIAAQRHAISSAVGNVSMDGGSLYATANTGSLCSTPAERGFIIASGTCMAAAAQTTNLLLAVDEDEIIPAQTSWQARVDSLAVEPGVTYKALVDGANAASLTADSTTAITNPYFLISVPSLTYWATVALKRE